MNGFVTRPTFDEGFAQWFNTASLEEIADTYCECYKDAHGIKARWVRAEDCDREGWADRFVALGHAIAAEQRRRDEADAAFLARVAALGLREWAERNGIRSEYDLYDHNDRVRWAESDPAPLPYEGMATIH